MWALLLRQELRKPRVAIPCRANAIRVGVWRRWRWRRSAWCSATSAPVPCTPFPPASPGPHIEVTPEHIFGVLSLIFWTLVLVILLKYVGVVLNADNKGEGGVLALTALVINTERASPRRKIYGTLGILGAALFFADGAITPAISVLSAVEGLHVAAPDGADPGTAHHRRRAGRTVPDPAPWHGFGGEGVRARDARVVRDPGRHGRELDRARTARAPGARSIACRAAVRQSPDQRAGGARGRVPDGHRRRGAVRRHGSLREGADPAGLDLHRHARTGAQLLRPGSAADREPGSDRTIRST